MVKPGPAPGQSPAALHPDVPLHHQIYLQLRSEIADGIWHGRIDFPGEKDVARKFGVSVITSRRALERLAAEGWLDRGRGRRARVLAPASTRPSEDPAGRRRPYSYRVLQRGVGIASTEACAAFALPPGSEFWLCSRVRSLDGRPHSVTQNAQRPELGLRHSLADLKKLPMSRLLAKEGHRIAEMRRSVSARFAPPLVAEQLGITMQDPALVYTFTVSDKAGHPLEWTRIFVHPDSPSIQETLNYETGEWRFTEPL